MNREVVLVCMPPMVVRNIFNIIQEGDIMVNHPILRYRQDQMES